MWGAAAKEKSAHVTVPVDLLPLLLRAGAQVFFTTKDEPVVNKERMTVYQLTGRGGGNRYILDPKAVRMCWAQACGMATGEEEILADFPFPLLRCGDGCLVTSRYPEVWEAGHVRIKVAVDFDALPTSSECEFPSPEQVFLRTCAFLQENVQDTPIVFADEPATVFLGSNAVKERSAHVIFHTVCFSSDLSNKLKNGDPLCTKFSAFVADMGFDADLGIQGLKWEFSDKPLKDGGWRANVLPLSQHFNCGNVGITTWADLAWRIDPHMLPEDYGWERTVSWKAGNKKAKKAAPKKKKKKAKDAAVVPADDVEKRVRSAFPGFFPDDVVFESKENGVVVPLTALCPLKQGEHTVSGKFFVVLHADGSVECKCQSSNCVPVRLDSARVVELQHADVIEACERVWVRVGTQAILRQSLTWESANVVSLSRSKFNQHTECIELNRGGFVTIEKTKFTKAQYWFDSTPTKYTQCVFSPPPQIVQHGCFNTYCGLDTSVRALADTMTNMSPEELDAEWKFTRDHIFNNLCAADVDAYKQLIGFHADMLLMPGRKPRWSVLLHGPQGAGKGLAMTFFSAPVGKRLYAHADALSLGEGFNGGLMEKLLLFSDEGIDVSKGDKMLKKLITEETQTVRRKYQENYDVQTCFRIVAACNDQPTWVQPGDRRWLVLYCDTRTTNEEGSLQLFNHEIAAESASLRGPAAFLELARRGLLTETFNPMETIQTVFKLALQEEQMSAFQLWWREMLQEESAPFFLAGEWCSKQSVYDAFASVGVRHKEMTFIKFWNENFQLLPLASWVFARRRLGGGSNAVSCVMCPSKQDLQAAFCRLYRLPPTYFEPVANEENDEN
jgi:hypothetical protein